MDRIKELETLIEEMRTKLEAYLDEEISFDEIYKLSDEIDKLVVEHCNLLELKK